MAKERTDLLPSGSSLTEVAARMVSELGPKVERAGGIIVVVKGEAGSSDMVAVLPAEEKQRLSEQDTRFKDKLVAIINQKDATKLGIAPQTPSPSTATQRGKPPAGKRLTTEERKKLKKQREKELRRKNRDER